MAKKAAGQLESAAEYRAVKKMEKLGWKSYKLNGLGKASKPDRLFIGEKSRLIFVEFKREGHRPTSLQADELQELFFHGQSVAVCVNFEDLDLALRAMTRIEGERRRGLPIFWRYWLHRNYEYKV